MSRIYKENRETDKLQHLLLEGLESCVSPLTKSDIESIRKKAHARMRQIRLKERRSSSVRHGLKAHAIAGWSNATIGWHTVLFTGKFETCRKCP